MLVFFLLHAGEGKGLLQMKAPPRANKRDFGTIRCLIRNLHCPLGLTRTALNLGKGRHEHESSLFCFTGGDSSVTKQNQVVRFPSLPEVATKCADQTTLSVWCAVESDRVQPQPFTLRGICHF